MIKCKLCLFLALLSVCSLLAACSNTEPKETEPNMDIMQKSDPAQDDELNILMIGNTYRPDYALDEGLIPTLQAAAHKAVEQKDAEDNK